TGGRCQGIFVWTPSGSGGRNVLFEGLYIHGYSDNVVLYQMENVRIYRCIVADAYSRKNDGSVAKSQGIYAARGMNGFTIEECIIDHNGWLDDGSSTTGPNIFNHNMYLNNGNTNVVVRRNIISDASSHGVQIRSGGIVEDNLVTHCAIGILMGGGDNLEANGVWALCRGNVVLSGKDIDAANKRGFGIDFKNISSGSISNNIVANRLSLTGGYFSIGKSVSGGPEGIGVNNLTVSNNVVYNWSSEIRFNSNCSGVVVSDNIVQDPTDRGRPLTDTYTYNDAEVDFKNNIYYSSRNTAEWFASNSRDVTLDQWQTTSEADCVIEQVAFVDPNRTTATYAQAVGAGSTHADFMREARKQSKMNWRQEYTIDALLSYFRAGFTRQN
ncbi:MAG: right-handed parallel beta-helix repeat-containing protein, partial [Planctomycetota bacterium]|nr:right-handed parallel beta-helix repeat-containing protein [Planctomycetota bacterium]